MHSQKYQNRARILHQQATSPHHRVEIYQRSLHQNLKKRKRKKQLARGGGTKQDLFLFFNY